MIDDSFFRSYAEYSRVPSYTRTMAVSEHSY